MSTMPNPTPEELAVLVAGKVAADPNFMPQSLAKELGVAEGSIIAALPEQMRVAAPAADFIPIWEAMAEWEKVTFLSATPGAILEIPCRLPVGKPGHGMYNLMDKSNPLCGHILMGNVATIWLVSKPVFGLESHSVQFFTAEGAQCFAVYLGRDSSRAIIPSVKEGFMALRARYAVN